MIPVSFETIVIPVAFDVDARAGWFEFDDSGDLTLWGLKREPFASRIMYDPCYERLSRSYEEVSELCRGRPCLGATGFDWLKKKSLLYEHFLLLLSTQPPISIGSAFLDWHLPKRYFTIAVYFWEVIRSEHPSRVSYRHLVSYFQRVEAFVRAAIGEIGE